MSLRLTVFLSLMAGPVLAGDICHDVDAKTGWQTISFPMGIVDTIFAKGTWSVDAGASALVGPQGYNGDVGQALIDAGPIRPFTSAPYGALLYHIEANGRDDVGPWRIFKNTLDQAGPFRMNGGIISFRINEADDALSNNTGKIEICARYQD